MEIWFRRMLEKIGGKLDARTASGEANLRELSLKLSVQVQRAVEENIRVEGSHHLAPHAMTLALPYELHSVLTQEARETLARQVLEAAENFIRDRRYKTQGTVQVRVTSDVFRDQPFVRVSFEAESGTDAAHKDMVLRIVGAGQVELLRTPLRPGDAVRLGRTKGNTLVVDDTSVSKFHAVLTLDPAGKLMVQDLGSTNGTYIEESPSPVEGSACIGSGQRIRLGDVELTIFFA